MLIEHDMRLVMNVCQHIAVPITPQRSPMARRPKSRRTPP